MDFKLEICSNKRLYLKNSPTGFSLTVPKCKMITKHLKTSALKRNQQAKKVFMPCKLPQLSPLLLTSTDTVSVFIKLPNAASKCLK